MDNNNQNNSMESCILLRLQSFAVLRQKVVNETSRFEAYCDLIDRAQCQNMRLDRSASKANLKHGEVMVTYSDLADSWHWTRASVRRFIEDLVDAGLASKRTFMKNFILSLPILSVDSANSGLMKDASPLRSAHGETNVNPFAEPCNMLESFDSGSGSQCDS